MPRWRINLYVLWLGQLLVMGGMTLILPFLSLYLQQELNITDVHEAATWAGIIFAGNFVTSFLIQPLWGKLSDRYGAKVMLLRSGFGMAIITALMGLVTNPWQLLALRLANGTISGFNPAAIALVAKQTPHEHTGFAMGLLQSGGIAGTLLGPLIGGILADQIGFRAIFYITGACLFAASLLAAFVIREDSPIAHAGHSDASVLEGIRQLVMQRPIGALITATFVLQFAMLGPMPVMPLYVQSLLDAQQAQHVAVWAGIVGAAAGLSNMFASPLLGRLSDRIGQRTVLIASLVGAGLLFVPLALSPNVYVLAAVRFIQGVFIGGLSPSINALLRKNSPSGMEGRVVSLNSSTLSLGNMAGPIVGGAISGFTGLGGLFFVSAALLLLNALWVRRSLSQAHQSPEALRRAADRLEPSDD